MPTNIKPSLSKDNDGFVFRGNDEVSLEVAVKQAVQSLQSLVAKDKYEKMHPFTLARLVPSKAKKGDYLVFYVWNVQKGEKERKRVFAPVEYKTEAEKRAYFKDTKKQINNALKEGYHIDEAKTRAQEQKEKNLKIKDDEENGFLEITVALDRIIALRTAKKYKSNGVDTFKRIMNRFIAWSDKKEVSLRYIQDIDFAAIQEYQIYILTILKNDAKTHNNKIGVLSAFYSECEKQNWIKVKENPFEKFDPLPTNYGTKNKPYTNKQIADMKTYILEHDPYLWNVIAFMYYSFLRPGELRDLRVGDIDLKNDVIRTWVESSKGKRCDVIPIAPALREIIIKMEIDNFHKDFYVFSPFKKPHKNRMGVSYMAKHFSTVKEHFGFDKDPDYTLYGFKHTAAVNWYKKEKDIRKIQKMMRHTTVRTTERYLKSMGLLEDENAVTGLPEI